jgi:ATP-dependent helicase/nuclease subunit B
VAIALVEAPDRRREVEAAGIECLRLCREEGYRFRDFALLSRDASLYADLVTATFRELGIPVFVDRRRSLTHHPAAELVRSALHVVARRWPADAVIRYLKTDLVVGETERFEVDLLERYARANGVRGDAFFSEAPWGRRRSPSLDEDRPPIGEEAALYERLDAFRRRALAPLAAFDRALEGGVSHAAVDITRRLFEHLEALEVQRKLAAWSGGPAVADPSGAGRDAGASARGHGQAWEGIVRLLEEAAEALGDEPLGVAEYADIIEAGLDELSEALPPPALDQVLLGSVERSRHPELRAAFVLGLNDGLFPRLASEDVVLNDADRRLLEGAGIEVAPTTEAELFHEPYYFYIAMTRARDRVVASCSRADETGRPLASSSFWALLRRAAPDVEPAPGGDLGTAVTPARLASAVAASFRRTAGGSAAPRLDLYGAMRADRSLRPAMELPFGALAAEPPQRLSQDLVGALYGPVLDGSVTQLEDFGQCPFKHLARRVLGLRAREEFQLAPQDVGSLCHAVLQVYADRVKAAGRRWADLDDAARARFLAEAAGEVAPRLRGPAFGRSRRDRHFLDEILKNLAQALTLMTERLRTSGFEPAASELDFGGRHKEAPPLEIPLRDGRIARISGKIDRVDLAEAGEPREAAAVDYKLNVPDSNDRRMAGGIALQLQVYLIALERLGPALIGRTLVPRRATYQGFIPSPQDVTSDDDVPAAGTPGFLKLLARSIETSAIGDGKTPGDLAGFLRYAEERLGLWATRILDGRCEPRPFALGRKSACDQCDFLDLCGFERGRHPVRRIHYEGRGTARAWMISNPGDREDLP